MAIILSGSPVAQTILTALRPRVSCLREVGIMPTLAILRVGEKADDLAYERGLMKRCSAVGIDVKSTFMPQDCTTDELISEIRRINEDNSVHGCLLLRPLPKQLDTQSICAILSPRKDVDGMTPASLGGVFMHSGVGYAPGAAQACMELLDYYGIDPTGMNAVVIGRSLVLGKPVAMLLQDRSATVTMCHTKTRDLAGICAKADILVAAAGCADLINKDYVNYSQTVIDAGINTRSDGSLCGDADFAAVEPLVRAITPVPNGVGAVTTAVLCARVVDAAEKVVDCWPGK